MISADNQRKIIKREKKVDYLKNQFEINHCLCGIAELLEKLYFEFDHMGGISFLTYETGLDFFDSMFTDQEVLKLKLTGNDEYKCYLFVLDTYELLNVEVHSFLKSCRVNVSKALINECIAHSYSNSRGNNKYFSFVDSQNNRIRSTDQYSSFMLEYESREYLESLEGRDIRDIIRTFNVNEIIERLLNANTEKLLADDISPSRIRII